MKSVDISNIENTDRDRVNAIMRWNYLLMVGLAIVSVLLIQQLVISKNLPKMDAAAVVAVNLEGDGVVPQSHIFNMKNINAQETVVLTELNTKGGAPLAVKVSTDTTSQGDKNVVIVD